jgi:hypothetical protein
MKIALVTVMIFLLVVNAHATDKDLAKAGNTVWRGGNQVMDMIRFCLDLTDDLSTDLECSYDSRAPDRLMFIGPSSSTLQKHVQFISRVSADFCTTRSHSSREVVFIDQAFSYFARNDCINAGFRELTQQEVMALTGAPSEKLSVEELKSTCLEINAQDWATCDLRLGKEEYEISITVPDIRAMKIFVERFEENYFRILCQSAHESGIKSGMATISSQDRSGAFVSTCTNGTPTRFVSR